MRQRWWATAAVVATSAALAGCTPSSGAPLGSGTIDEEWHAVAFQGPGLDDWKTADVWLVSKDHPPRQVGDYREWAAKALDGSGAGALPIAISSEHQTMLISVGEADGSASQWAIADLKVHTAIPVPGCAEGVADGSGDYVLLEARDDGWLVAGDCGDGNQVRAVIDAVDGKLRDIVPLGYDIQPGFWDVDGDRWINVAGPYMWCGEPGSRDDGQWLVACMGPGYGANPQVLVVNQDGGAELASGDSLDEWRVANVFVSQGTDFVNVYGIDGPPSLLTWDTGELVTIDGAAPLGLETSEHGLLVANGLDPWAADATSGESVGVYDSETGEYELWMTIDRLEPDQANGFEQRPYVDAFSVPIE